MPFDGTLKIFSYEILNPEKEYLAVHHPVITVITQVHLKLILSEAYVKEPTLKLLSRVSLRRTD